MKTKVINTVTNEEQIYSGLDPIESLVSAYMLEHGQTFYLADEPTRSHYAEKVKETSKQFKLGEFIVKKDNRKLFKPDGSPRYVRCYDNPYSFDRYTVVFGKKRNAPISDGGMFMYVGMNSTPFHPQGFCIHGESFNAIDRPAYSHLGKRIDFKDLPEDCQAVVMQDYEDIWNI